MIEFYKLFNSGTSEGVRKAWETRRNNPGLAASEYATLASKAGFGTRHFAHKKSFDAWNASAKVALGVGGNNQAYDAHREAADAQRDAARFLKGATGSKALMDHLDAIDSHDKQAAYHLKEHTQ